MVLAKRKLRFGVGVELSLLLKINKLPVIVIPLLLIHPALPTDEG